MRFHGSTAAVTAVGGSGRQVRGGGGAPVTVAAMAMAVAAMVAAMGWVVVRGRCSGAAVVG
ncbi:hypothetical protein [Streptomyces bohaiensis]|uniref:hypothetical protein n=1 Tax=Streptomyces bohaiensis TaxID=1431344 RepID=UPI003B820F6A